jgi:hypothetical protein
MKTKKCFLVQVILSLSVILLFCNFAQAETTNCTVITSLPITITTQGIYCLTSDLSTSMASGMAITIANNNVMIDLNGHKLGGLAAGSGTQVYGIYADQRKNITIRNGTVRGFYYGIWLHDLSPFTTSQGHLIEDIRADMNTFFGINVAGKGNIIRNNQVVSTGGSTNTYDAYGIVAVGPGSRVLNNDIIETKEQSTGVAAGIYGPISPGSVVENNRIGNSSLGTGTSYGINIKNSSDVLVSNNRVTTMNYGVDYAIGSTGKYRDNLTSGVTFPYSGGTNAGNNN